MLTHRINSCRGAQAVVATLVRHFVNLCTANNTIAIITVGDIAHKISQQFQLDGRKVASLLDTCSCIIQSLIPYGAQSLMAAGLCPPQPCGIPSLPLLHLGAQRDGDYLYRIQSPSPQSLATFGYRLLKNLVDEGGYIAHINVAIAINIGGIGCHTLFQNDINQCCHIGHITHAIAIQVTNNETAIAAACR